MSQLPEPLYALLLAPDFPGQKREHRQCPSRFTYQVRCVPLPTAAVRWSLKRLQPRCLTPCKRYGSPVQVFVIVLLRNRDIFGSTLTSSWETRTFDTRAGLPLLFLPALRSPLYLRSAADEWLPDPRSTEQASRGSAEFVPFTFCGGNSESQEETQGFLEYETLRYTLEYVSQGVDIMPHKGEDYSLFCDAVQGLVRGDFSRLEPLFKNHSSLGGRRCRILEWHDKGYFGDEPRARRSLHLYLFSWSNGCCRLSPDTGCGSVRWSQHAIERFSLGRKSRAAGDGQDARPAKAAAGS